MGGYKFRKNRNMVSPAQDLPSASQNRHRRLFLHTVNGELIDFWPHELKKLNRLGIGVLLVEYPGYGRSNGSPSQKNITEAFTGAYDMLVTRPDVDPSRIVLFGRSLGGGAVCILAANPAFGGTYFDVVIFQRPFVRVKISGSRYSCQRPLR